MFDHPPTTGWLIFYNTIFSSKYLWHLGSRFMIIIVRAIKLDIIHLSRVSWLRCGPCRPTIRICSHQDCIKSMLDHTSATFILCITLFGTFAHQDCIKGIQNFLHTLLSTIKVHIGVIWSMQTADWKDKNSDKCKLQEAATRTALKMRLFEDSSKKWHL